METPLCVEYDLDTELQKENDCVLSTRRYKSAFSVFIKGNVLHPQNAKWFLSNSIQLYYAYFLAYGSDLQKDHTITRVSLSLFVVLQVKKVVRRIRSFRDVGFA